MSKPCQQTKTINEIERKLEDHIEKQIESDKERMQYREERRIHDDYLSGQIESINSNLADLLELNKDVRDFKTAWRVGKGIGFGTATLIATAGVILGGIYAIREWFQGK